MVALDVLADILLTLEVKDILSCKSVCKSWYSFISSPFFLSLHLKHIRDNEYKNNKQFGNRRICKGNCYTSNIEGSSNGLVCISSIDHSKICLSNPTTTQFRILPDPIILPDTNKGYAVSQCYGFGYDSSTDVLKLVMAINQGTNGTLVQILSLKSNIWRVFGHVSYKFRVNEPGILLNGMLHWFWFKSNFIKKEVIVSFDLAREEFREIPIPQDWRYDEHCLTHLGIFEDHLCMFNVCPGGRVSHLWVMRNYNVKQSWELLQTYCTKDDRVHYMNDDCRLSRETPSYFCCDALLSGTGRHMSAPIFLQTLISPYFERPSVAKKYKRTANRRVVRKEERDE